MTTDEMKNDIVDIIRTFDDVLDNMYDRGAFDTSLKEDAEIEDYINTMKKKYIGE